MINLLAPQNGIRGSSPDPLSQAGQPNAEFSPHQCTIVVKSVRTSPKHFRMGIGTECPQGGRNENPPNPHPLRVPEKNNQNWSQQHYLYYVLYIIHETALC